MDWHDIALMAAGVIGGGITLAHGILVQRLFVRRIGALFAADGQVPAPTQRLVPLLLHFTTFAWLLGSLVLIAASIWFDRDAKLVTGLFAGSSFLYGCLGAAWGVRRFHISWAGMAVAVILTVLGLWR